MTQTHAISEPSGLIDGVVSPVVCQDQYLGVIFIDPWVASRSSGSSSGIGAFEYGALPAGFLIRDVFEQGNRWTWNDGGS